MLKIAQAICVFTVGIAGLGSSAVYAQTNIPVQVARTTGLVGLAEGQTAQLNALNPDAATPSATTAGCSGVLSFIADNGTVLKTKAVTVAPGTGQHIDLDSVIDLALAVGTRREIRATISVAAAPATASTTTIQPACRLIGTLEIYNTDNGHSQVTLGAVHEVASPVPASGT